MSSPAVDHDAAMRIADRHLKLETHIERHLRTADYEGPEFPLPVNSAIVTLARAYKDVVRDALTPEEARAIVHYFDVTTGNEDFILTSEYSAITKLRRIAARAATTKPEGENE